MTAPMSHTKNSDEQSQHCAFKSKYFKLSTQEGWSFTQPLSKHGQGGEVVIIFPK